MRKIVIITITLALLTCGFAFADRGIDPVPETQGITIATTLDLVGNFASTTDIQWRITDDPAGLDGIPPLNGMGILGQGTTYYASAYTDDTYSNGIGLIAYDKNMDVETSEQISGQWNIDADKQIEFVGVDGARVYSDEYVMVDGVGNYSWTDDDKLCVFAYGKEREYWSDGESSVEVIHPRVLPAYCNFAESGSTIDMTVANVRTNSMDRLIIPSADTSVELEHDIQVTELIDGLPSSGTASAYMDVLIMEARGLQWVVEMDPWSITRSSPPMERIEFGEVTSVTGDITVFDKQMNYNSMYTGQGELNSLVVIPLEDGNGT